MREPAQHRRVWRAADAADRLPGAPLLIDNEVFGLAGLQDRSPKVSQFRRRLTVGTGPEALDSDVKEIEDALKNSTAVLDFYHDAAQLQLASKVGKDHDTLTKTPKPMGNQDTTAWIKAAGDAQKTIHDALKALCDLPPDPKLNVMRGVDWSAIKD